MDKSSQIISGFRFNLRTLFILMALAAIFCSWVGSQLHWKANRQQFLHKTNVRVMEPGSRQLAPGLLRWFGEDGYPMLYISKTGEVEVQEAERLFPESLVLWTK